MIGYARLRPQTQAAPNMRPAPASLPEVTMPAVGVFDSALWSSDERQYFDAVDHTYAGSKNMLIGNGNAKHAVFLMDRFLRSAQREIRLFSGSLVQNVPHEGDRSLDVYANTHLIESAATFLKRPRAALRILLEGDLDGTPQEHPLIQAGQPNGRDLHGRAGVRKVARCTPRSRLPAPLDDGGRHRLSN